MSNSNQKLKTLKEKTTYNNMKDNYPRYKMFREKYERGEFIPFKYYKKIRQDKLEEEFEKYLKRKNQ